MPCMNDQCQSRNPNTLFRHLNYSNTHKGAQMEHGRGELQSRATYSASPILVDTRNHITVKLGRQFTLLYILNVAEELYDTLISSCLIYARP